MPDAWGKPFLFEQFKILGDTIMKPTTLAIFGVFALLFLSTGCSFINFNWKYNFNLSTSLMNYTADGSGVQVRILMNTSNMFVNSSCVDTIYCNDSAVTWLNGSTEQQIYYWWENYSFGFATLWIKAPVLNTTDNVFYLYYNSTLVSRSGYYSGRDTFIRFNDFENYTNGSRPSADFDGYSTPANSSQLYVTDSGCLRGDRCLYFNMEDTKGVTYGLLSNQFSSGILEFFYKTTGTQSDASAYWGTGINGTPEGLQYVTGSGSIVLQTNWTFIRWQWNGTGSLGNFTETGNSHEMQMSVGQNFTQQIFPFHIAATQPFYSDNYILRVYMLHDAVIKTMSGISEVIPSINYYIINGSVIGCDGGLSGATIRINGSGVDSTTLSNGSGYWEFTSLPNVAATYTITANNTGNRNINSTSKTITITGNRGDIELSLMLSYCTQFNPGSDFPKMIQDAIGGFLYGLSKSSGAMVFAVLAVLGLGMLVLILRRR